MSTRGNAGMSALLCRVMGHTRSEYANEAGSTLLVLHRCHRCGMTVAWIHPRATEQERQQAEELLLPLKKPLHRIG